MNPHGHGTEGTTGAFSDVCARLDALAALERAAARPGFEGRLLTAIEDGAVAALLDALATAERASAPATLESGTLRAVLASQPAERTAGVELQTAELHDRVQSLASLARIDAPATLEDRLFAATRGIISGAAATPRLVERDAAAGTRRVVVRPATYRLFGSRWSAAAALLALATIGGAMIPLLRRDHAPVLSAGESLARDFDAKAEELFDLLDTALGPPTDGAPGDGVNTTDDTMNCMECDWYQTSNPWDEGVTS